LAKKRGEEAMTMSTTPHWPQPVLTLRDIIGMGQVVNPQSADAAAAAATQNSTALAMNDALNAHGYKQSDMGLYQAFQSAVGLTPDGYPGTNTMHELKDVLFSLGVEMANVPIYPWLASGGYDGVNAPLLSDWAPGSGGGGSGGGGGTITTPTTTVTASSGGGSKAGWWIVGGAAAVGVTAVTVAYYRKRRRMRR
jgi:hypothetical protein